MRFDRGFGLAHTRTALGWLCVDPTPRRLGACLPALAVSVWGPLQARLLLVLLAFPFEPSCVSVSVALTLLVLLWWRRLVVYKSQGWGMDALGPW